MNLLKKECCFLISLVPQSDWSLNHIVQNELSKLEFRSAESLFSVTTFPHNKVIDTAVLILSQLGCKRVLSTPSNPRSKCCIEQIFLHLVFLLNLPKSTRHPLLQRQNIRSYFQFSKVRKKKIQLFFNKHENSRLKCVIMPGCNHPYIWKTLGLTIYMFGDLAKTDIQTRVKTQNDNLTMQKT